MTFARPAQKEDGDREFFSMKERKGDLVVFEVSRFDPQYTNHFDEVRPAVRTKVTVIDGDKAGTVYPGTWIEATYVVEELEDHVNGDPVLARIEKGKKAYFLGQPSDEDVAAAEAHFAGDVATPDPDDDDEPPF